MRARGTVNNYRFYLHGTSDFALPFETDELQVIGNVVDSPKYDDGKCIRSTTLKSVDMSLRKAYSTIGAYKLGTIDDEYAEWLDDEGYVIPNELH